MTPPPSVRVFIAGASGAGKSTVAWRAYLERFPRRILLDLTGEWTERADVTVWGSVREFSKVLRQLAPRGRWTIAMVPDDLEAFVAYLAPVPELTRSPIVGVGGAVLLVDEVDIIAPPHSARSEVRMLWRRSRHLGLSIVATTQRPEAVSREVTSQSPQVLCLQLIEPAAWDYMSDLMRLNLAGLQEWVRRHPHGGLWVETRTGEQRWLDEAGHWLRPAVPLAAARHLPGGTAAPSGSAAPVGARVPDAPTAGPSARSPGAA